MLKIWSICFLLAQLLGSTILIGRLSVLEVALVGAIWFVLSVCWSCWIHQKGDVSGPSHASAAKQAWLPSLVGAVALLWGLLTSAPRPQRAGTMAAPVFTTSSSIRKQSGVIIAAGGQRRYLEPLAGRWRVMADPELFATHRVQPAFAYERHHLANKSNDTWGLSRQLSDRQRAWLSAVIYGQRSPEMLDAFRSLGVVHLLVVSGLHITLGAACLCGVIMWPLRLMYAVRLISPSAWRYCYAFGMLLTSSAALTYCQWAGWGGAAQRAGLLYLMHCGARLGLTREQPIALAFALQTLFFPVGFLSTSTLLSWLAYLLVRREFQDGVSLRSLWRLQWRMVVVVAAAIGTFAPAALYANILLVTIFPLVLFASLVLLVNPPLISGVAALGIDHFLNLIDRINYINQLADPWLAARPVGPAPRALMIGAAGIIFLNSWPRRTITSSS